MNEETLSNWQVEVTNPSGSRSYFYFGDENPVTAARAAELAEMHLAATCSQATVSAVREA